VPSWVLSQTKSWRTTVVGKVGCERCESWSFSLLLRRSVGQPVYSAAHWWAGSGGVVSLQAVVSFPVRVSGGQACDETRNSGCAR
jgi:hypothetical protein